MFVQNIVWRRKPLNDGLRPFYTTPYFKLGARRYLVTYTHTMERTKPTFFLPKQYRRLIWLVLPGLFCLGSCSDPPPLKLTLEQREWVDTLYFRRIEGMGLRMDSLCVEKRKQILSTLTDSILLVRRKEEEALRAKYQK